MCCFHSREIRRHDKAFSDKLIDNSLFLIDLTKTLNNTKCKIISVTIDLVSYLKKGYFQSIYEKAFDILKTKIDGYPKFNNKGLKIFHQNNKIKNSISCFLSYAIQHTPNWKIFSFSKIIISYNM